MVSAQQDGFRVRQIQDKHLAFAGDSLEEGRLRAGLADEQPGRVQANVSQIDLVFRGAGELQGGDRRGARLLTDSL